MNILVLNSGSSSLKYKLFSTVKEEVLAYGLVERIGMPGDWARLPTKFSRMVSTRLKRRSPTTNRVYV